MKKSEQIAGECSWSLFGSFFLYSRRKKMQKAEHRIQTLSQGFIYCNINIVETDNGWVSSVDRNFAPC